MNENKHKFFQKLVMSFFKKGKRSMIEGKVRFFFKNKIKKNKNLILKQAEKSVSNLKPYVRLFVRKRGKRNLYKIGYLKKIKSDKKAYLSIVKGLRENKKDYFLTGLQKEIQNLSKKKANLVLKRNDLHKTAKRFAPKKWFMKIKWERWKKRYMRRNKYLSKKKVFFLKKKEIFQNKASRWLFKLKIWKCEEFKKEKIKYKEIKKKKKKKIRK